VFGHTSILAIGDLYQLPPVLQPMLFEQTSNAYTSLYNSGSLWKYHFRLFELTETVCQKGDKRFAELLERFRTASCTKEDYALLLQCIQKQHFMCLGL